MTGVLPLQSIGRLVLPVRSVEPQPDASGETFRYIDLSAVDQGLKAIVSDREVPAVEAPSRARQLVEAGDILVSTVRPNLNAVAVVPERLDQAIASTGFCVLRPDPAWLDNSYLFYWVRTQSFIGEMVRRATGASYPAVSDRIIHESTIPLPPLEEQRRIAAILDKADALRQKRRAALQKLDSLTQSIFLDMFGDPATHDLEWPIAKLGDVCIFENGDRSSNYPSGEDIKTSGVLFLNGKNIVNNRLNLESPTFISPEKFASMSRGKAQRNDLIITLRGTLGSCCIFDCKAREAFINAQMMIVRVTEKIIPRFLHALLTLKSSTARFARMSTGVAVPQLTSAQLRDWPVIIPPMELQERFAESLSMLEALRDVRLQSDSLEGALFSSLQHRAFRGEL